jgi:spermidine synthase
LTNPKVTIEFDDGRRWLVRNESRRFDAVVSNTSFHWRVHTSNLLSTDFLELVRSRLREGGVFYYNTTDSPRAQKTGVSVFPHALRIQNFLAVSDRPMVFDRRLWTRQLAAYPRGGRPLFDLANEQDRKLLEEVTRRVEVDLETRESIVARTQDAVLVTDDNMGTEWSAGFHG